MQTGRDPIPSRFRDRADAGRYLGELLSDYAGRSDVVVLALPRGGVPVGFEVAQALEAPLDVFVVRKLGVPGHEELAFGAIASGGARILNRDVVRHVGLTVEAVETISERERRDYHETDYKDTHATTHSNHLHYQPAYLLHRQGKEGSGRHL